MKVTPRPQPEFYIKRNVQLLKDFYALRAEKVTVRKAVVIVADNYSKSNPKDKIGSSVIWNVVYNPHYPYGPEAWKIYNQEDVKIPVKSLT